MSAPEEADEKYHGDQDGESVEGHLKWVVGVGR